MGLCNYFARLSDDELEKIASGLIDGEVSEWGVQIRTFALDPEITETKKLWRKVVGFIADEYARQGKQMGAEERATALRFARRAYALFLLRRRRNPLFWK